ncbi:MAG: membrane-bound lytic murein transglycosylase MltC [Arsenophonus sp. ET-DL9-MAG3]
MKKLLISLIISQFLLACSSKKEVFFYSKHLKDTNTFDILVQQFANNIENIWGTKEILIAGPKYYVKYIDQYKTRTHINFDSGNIIIETIADVELKEYLKKAIIITLLMGDDSRTVDFYSNINNVFLSKKPFLYGQVLDHTNQPIRWKWRATKFADYLLKNKLKKRQSGLHIIWSITIKLTPNHLNKRAHKYLSYIRHAATKYNVDESLILAIMQIESNFNPYAVSRSNALGLMQIMQNTAGKDVFRAQGKSGIPTKDYLLNPANNIDLGAAYLSLLQNTYLNKITNATSRRYAIISAYNSGVNSVLKIFHKDKKLASQIINQMLPDDVYKRLVTKHPMTQSRNYLIKLNNLHKIIVNNIFT